jgi:multidrug efflux pump subunit AcrB
MNLADVALRNRITTLVLTAGLLFGGIHAYGNLSRLEDPEFTIKDAMISTPYPGATAAEVEEEVSDRIVIAIQQLGQLDWIESTNYRGQSVIKAHILDQYDKDALPQVWDELRRKVGDIQGELPPGAGPSVVNDDFGDVWGVFVAIYGPEYSDAELKEHAKMLRKDLLLVDDVAKIDFWGARTEAVYVEQNRERMSQLGIRPETIIRELRSKNLVSDAGRVEVGPDFLPVDPTGLFRSEQQFNKLLISGRGSDRQIFLEDIATVRRGYVEPPTNVLRYDGKRAIGLGISTKQGGNVVRMGEAIARRARELTERMPLGIEVGIISLQSEATTVAIEGFLESLMQAVAIVIAVLLLFMGLRSGLIIGFILALTISGTFIFMGPWDVALERISLGALIIALGMLVDNAIVVVDGMLVRIQSGTDAEEAAREVVAQQSMPLLGATAVAIMAFASIGLSNDGTGEYCRSLFKVVFISLGLSWVTAMTVTPVICVMFLKPPEKKDAEAGDPYGGSFYQGYRGMLAACIRFRGLTVGVVGAVFALAVYGFGYIDNSFFPDSTRPQFMIDFWLPQGTHIDETVREATDVEEYLLGLDGVTHVSTCVGGGAMRFLLTYDPERPNTGYAQFFVDVDDYEKIAGMVGPVEQHLAERHPNAVSSVKLFRLGPGAGGRIQIRFMGRDVNVLRGLAHQAETILYEDGGAKGIRNDWRNRVVTMRPQLAEEEANLAGIQRRDVSEAIRSSFQGQNVGVYREHDELLPIVIRAPEQERTVIDSINSLQIWSPAADQTIPLRQVVSGFATVMEDDMIWRLNRKRTLTIHADPTSGSPSVLLGRIKPKVEALELPPGYELEWWGEYRDSNRSQAAIAASVPMFLLAMVAIVIMLFNDLRQPLVIWLIVPLALIGVTLGLLLTRQPFGFMSLLGFMSLSGMLIKNAIVLIDEIEIQRRQGNEPYAAIMSAGVSRLRPIAMAALTTALGMIPLLMDAFFVAMAVTIIFGLMIATFLTTLVVPVFYAMVFRVPTPRPDAPGGPG